MNKKPYDVIIVGSGVAGALAAHRFLDKNLRVLMLEAGPEPESRQTMLERYQRATIKVPSAPYKDFAAAPRPDLSKPNDYYIQKGSLPFNSGYERLVGGSTWHWLGSCLRLLPEDFQMKSKFGVAVDWPIDYSTMEPYYQKAETFLRVAGDDRFDLGSPRQNPYPQPAVPISYLDKVIARRIKGKRFEDRPYVLATNPQARHPKRCLGSNSCVPICPVGAKYEAYHDIQAAQKKGLHLKTQAVAHSLQVSKEGAIQSLTYLDWDGSAHKVQATIYVVAAGGIETPKLLLNSRTESIPNGVANSSTMVGRHLMDHPVQLGWALMPEKVWPYRGPLSTSGFDHMRQGVFRKQIAASRLEIHNDGWGWAEGGPTTEAKELIAKGLKGEQLKKALRDRCLAQISVATLLEQLPNPDSRVVLSESKFDKLGIPRPELHYHLSDYEQNGFKKAAEHRKHLFESLDCYDIRSNQMVFGAGHIMGTTKMGISPKDSVVDSWGQSHDHQNLFILGSSNFPTGGTANPTLTLVALAERSADRILARFTDS